MTLSIILESSALWSYQAYPYICMRTPAISLHAPRPPKKTNQTKKIVTEQNT